MSARIYLDNAATSWPKPTAVYDAVDAWQRNNGAAAGRGGYRAAQESDRRVAAARAAVARILRVPRDSQVVFTGNATEGLNLALFGLLRPGDHVVTTVAEHNSILRPLAALRDRGVEVSYAACDAEGRVGVDQVRAQLRPQTRLVAITHASNVTGAIQDVDRVTELAHQAGALILIDAAQTAGHMPMDLEQLPADMLVASGHKGLLGPLGTGIVVLRSSLAEQLCPLRYGGTGTDSEDERPPARGPARFEAGNLNVPGLVGLEAGIAYLEHDFAVVQSRIGHLNQLALQRLGECPGVRWTGPRDADRRVGLVALVIEGMEAHEAASICDASAGIQVRAGLHCAPRMHRHLGVGGTLRASWGPFTTDEDLLAFCDLIRELAASSLRR